MKRKLLLFILKTGLYLSPKPSVWFAICFIILLILKHQMMDKVQENNSFW